MKNFEKVKNAKALTIGIDAVNLRGGGGVTHLVELLRAADPAAQGITRVVVWGGTLTLNALADRPWLVKRSKPTFDKGLLHRTLWQRYCLSSAARDEQCDLLFVPGGSYAGNFHPVVTMSQNLLPFEMGELLRYGWTLFTFKMLLLRITQSRSFRNTEGVIFLTKYARDVVLSVTGKLRGQSCIIAHGLNPRFNKPPKLQRAIDDYDDAHPYRILYVSIVDLYKHQWHVVEAVANLRRMGVPIALDLVGPAHPVALKRLNEVVARVDVDHHWVRYWGPIPHSKMPSMYSLADAAIWASTCETFGLILLETMAAGLPTACSSKQPMPEVLGEPGVYFDPERPSDIARALRELIESPQLRTELADSGCQRAQRFSWQRCAHDTFQFMLDVMRSNERRIDV